MQFSRLKRQISSLIATILDQRLITPVVAMNGNQDLDLFREMMSDVTELKSDTMIQTSQKHSPTEAQLARQVSAQRLCDGDPDFLSVDFAKMVKPDDLVAFKRPGVQDGVYRKLRLGKYDIQARLDLHKYTLNDARDEILRFLKQCQKLDARTVVIVHGKGERSTPPARMKSFVCQWLEQIEDVMCFHSAQRHQGGTGAVYVMLKKSQEKKHETKERHIGRHA